MLPLVRVRLVCLAAVMLAGCFPIELDVSPDGKLVISRQEGWFVLDPKTSDVQRVRSAGTGDLPVFARFSPDRRELLTVAEIAEGVGRFDLRMGPANGSPGRLLLRTRNPAYVEFAPDGSLIALTRLSTQPLEAGKEEESLELALLRVATGEVRVLHRPVAPLVRWLDGGRSLLALQVIRRTEPGHILADLVRIDAASGDVQVVARLLCGESAHFDIAPDGRRAAVCCYVAGPPGGELEAADYPRQRLVLVDLSTAAIQSTDQPAAYALFSPTGDQLLIGTFPTGGSLSRGAKLLATDTSGKLRRELASDIHVAAFGGETAVYPGWIDDEQVFYFQEQLTYGVAGRALALMTVRTDGQDRRALQPYIDQAAAEITSRRE